MSWFTHFWDDNRQESTFWVKNSVSWAKSALLRGIYCIFHWVNFANLRLCVKMTHLTRKLKIRVWRKFSLPFLLPTKGCQVLPPWVWDYLIIPLLYLGPSIELEILLSVSHITLLIFATFLCWFRECFENMFSDFLFSQEESNWPGCWMFRSHFRICSLCTISENVQPFLLKGIFKIF